MQPETISQFGENARMAEMICMMEMFKLEEEIGTNLGDMKRRTMTEVRYDSIEKFVWDHSVSSLKVTTEFYFFLALPRSLICSHTCRLHHYRSRHGEHKNPKA